MTDQTTLFKERLKKNKETTQQLAVAAQKIKIDKHETTKFFFAIAIGILYALYVCYIGLVIFLNTDSKMVVEVAQEFGISQIIPIVTLVFGYYFGQSKT